MEDKNDAQYADLKTLAFMCCRVDLWIERTSWRLEERNYKDVYCSFRYTPQPGELQVDLLFMHKWIKSLIIRHAMCQSKLKIQLRFKISHLPLRCSSRQQTGCCFYSCIMLQCFLSHLSHYHHWSLSHFALHFCCRYLGNAAQQWEKCRSGRVKQTFLKCNNKRTHSWWMRLNT